MKCDVIIPVYKAPEWVKLCVYALIKNTDKKVINKIYLINDCDCKNTINCLNNLKLKYPDVIEVIQNETNLGFVKTVNKGLKLVTANTTLLLNTDCIVSKNTISKLISHIEKDKEIGLICPVSSNAANLTLEMFKGFTYASMNELLERKFLGMSFDACTVVGNCLMITKDCLDKVGFLDEAYGLGYGEETDYQFKAMAAGFKARVAIDTYVFHKSEVSFGTSKEKQLRLNKNRELFFSRWSEEYNKLINIYQKNDPIKYILDNISEQDKKITYEFFIYIIGFSQNAGGVHIAVDIINYLSINNVNCNIIYGAMNDYKEAVLFNPIPAVEAVNYDVKKIVATIYLSVYYASYIAKQKNIPLIYFAQGYEPYFENGINYGIAELSYKIADEVLTISHYLKEMYKSRFNVASTVIENGINYDLLHQEIKKDKVKNITFVLRGTVLKGDFILLDIIKTMINKYDDLTINVLVNNKNLIPPFNDNKSIKVNYHYGPFTRNEMSDFLSITDLYIDASLSEGFGLIAVEAMTKGIVPIVSDSGGINEYLKDNVNGFIIKEVNNANCYIEKIDYLINNSKKFIEMSNEARNTSKLFDNDKTVEKYKKYFKKDISIKNIKLTEEEENLYNSVLNKTFKVSNTSKCKQFIYNLCRKTPKGFRIWLKKKVEKLYHFVNER